MFACMYVYNGPSPIRLTDSTLLYHQNLVKDSAWKV